MFRKVAAFYLWGMGLSLLITMYLGAQGAGFAEVMPMAMLSWPAAFLIMLVGNKARKIKSEVYT